MLDSFSATSTVAAATAVYTHLNPAVILGIAFLVAFAVGRYAIKLISRGAK